MFFSFNFTILCLTELSFLTSDGNLRIKGLNIERVVCHVTGSTGSLGVGGVSCDRKYRFTGSLQHTDV